MAVVKVRGHSGTDRGECVYFTGGEVSTMICPVSRLVEEVLAFYRGNMSRMGWAADGEEFVEGAHFLFFNRDNQDAMIIIEPGEGVTMLGVAVGPA